MMLVLFAAVETFGRFERGIVARAGISEEGRDCTSQGFSRGQNPDQRRMLTFSLSHMSYSLLK